MVGRNDADNKGVSVESQSFRRHAVGNGDGSCAGNPILGCVGETVGNSGMVRDSRLSPSHSRIIVDSSAAAGNDNVGLNDRDVAWLQSGTRGNTSKTKAKASTMVGTGELNDCNGTTTTKAMGNAFNGNSNVGHKLAGDRDIMGGIGYV